MKKYLLKELFGFNKTNPITDLKDYLTQDLSEKLDELALRFSSPIIFNQYKKTNKSEKDLYEFLENDKKERRKFAKWLIDKLKNLKVKIDDLRLENYPAWATLEYKYDFNNEYVIHFTDSGESIATTGFKYGVSDIEKLATTNLLSRKDKANGGYNFGFLLKDKATVNEYLKNTDTYTYGKEFIIFKTSGIVCYHIGDKQDQAIFWGKDVEPKNIKLFLTHNNQYHYYDQFNNKIIKSSPDISEIISYAIKYH